MENKHAGGVGGIAVRPEGESASGSAPKTDTIKQGEPKGINIYDTQCVIRSARVMIKFPPEKDSELPDEDKPNGSKTRQPYSNDLVSDNSLLDLPEKAGQRQNDHFLFHGVIRDDDNKTIEGAVVMVYTCSEDGEERLIGHCFTGSDGTYALSVPKLPDFNSIDGFKVRAGMNVQTAAEPVPPVYESKKPVSKEMHTGFHRFLRRIYSNPGKTLPELLDSF